MTDAAKFFCDYVFSPYDDENPSGLDVMIEEGNALYVSDGNWDDEIKMYVFPDGSGLSEKTLEAGTKQKKVYNEYYYNVLRYDV